jgi:hypothetical protein
MPITETDIHEIQLKIEPLLGKKAWGVSLGVGSFVTLEFGAPLPYEKIPNRFHGEWHLWITHCAWRLEVGIKVLAASEDPRPKLKKAVQHLEELALCSVVLTLPALQTTFTFDNRVVLHLFPIYTEEFECWMLYTPDGNVLTIGPGDRWSYKNSDEPPNSA